MKRQKICLEDIAERKNLVRAFHKAARGKRHRANVRAFMLNFDVNLNRLAKDIRREKLPYGRYRAFEIYDPKRRLIHAACFEDRVFHHALMNIAGSTFERGMTYHSYACRPEKGIHKAVAQVQANLRRYAWYGKIDIASYFPSIPHDRLLALLGRRFKGEWLNNQFWRILESHAGASGRGLPIGSLTSQYFANYYLDSLDRLLMNLPEVRANVRYMDDIIWWCDSRQEVKNVLAKVTAYLVEQLLLSVKKSVQIQSSIQGVSYCGFRLSKGCIRLSRRRKRSYQQRRQYWEQCYLRGEITEQQLQQAYASVEAITQGTDSKTWRGENLRRYPPVAI